MDTNESIRSNTPEQIIVLGIASIETKGSGIPDNEPMGRTGDVGISEQ